MEKYTERYLIASTYRANSNRVVDIDGKISELKYMLDSLELSIKREQERIKDLELLIEYSQPKTWQLYLIELQTSNANYRIKDIEGVINWIENAITGLNYLAKSNRDDIKLAEKRINNKEQ